MSRVEIPAPGDLIMDEDGNVQANVTVSLKLAGTGTDATHYSALTAGTSTTGGLKSGADGTIVDGSGNRRYIDEGAALDLTIAGRTRQLDPVAAAVYIPRSKRPVHVKDQIGFTGDGVTSDQTAYASAISALPTRGGTLALPAAISVPGNALQTITQRGVKIVGEGWSANVNAAFANAAWLVDSNFGGTILRFSNTTGASINMSDVATLNGNGLRDLLVVGPGSGTSTGIQLGNVSPSAGLVKATVENVLVANYSLGWAIRFVEDSLFESPTSRGCKTGFTLTDATNQNVFINTEVQFSDTDAVTLQASGGNQFYGGLLQNISGTAGIRIIDNDVNLFDGWWAEGVTAPWVIDILAGTRNAFTNWRMGSNVVDAVRVGGNATTLRNLHITGASDTVSILSGKFFTIVENVSGTFSDLGTGTRVLDRAEFRHPVRSVTNTTTTVDDHFIRSDCAGASRIITLHSAATCTGQKLAVMKISAGGNTVTLTPAGAETINGAASKVISTQYEVVTIISNGTNWEIIT